jgi:predicted Zn-dependent peptidase
LGFRTGYDSKENKYYLLQLFNEVFGGSPTSKLFMNVREKMSLCYFCRSIVNQRNGVMIVASGIEFENKEIAEKAILDQLNAIKEGNISEAEFESARKSIRNGYMQIYDSADSMEIWTFFRSLCGSYVTPMSECERVEKATIEDIKEVAKKMTLDTVYFLKGKSTEVKNG